jgi:hypothetical protein
MKIRETVSELIADNEKAFKDMPEARAAKLVQQVLEAIGKQIEETAEGRVTVQGLGMFIIKNVEREKDGTKATVKRITFRVKGGGGDGEGAAAKKAARNERKAGKAGEGESAEGDAGEGKTRDPAERTAAKAARKAARKEGKGGKAGKGAGRKARDSEE